MIKRNSKTCLSCGKKFLFEGRSYRRKYCSFKCSNAHHDFKKMGRKGGLTRSKNTEKRGNPGKRSKEEIGRLRTIASSGGIISAQIQAKKNRSRGENYLAKLLRERELKVYQSIWNIVSGYEIDIWLPELKAAISYNGPVHYKPIYGEKRLIQVIRRDKYRERKLKELGMKHIVIKDLERFNKERIEQHCHQVLTNLNLIEN